MANIDLVEYVNIQPADIQPKMQHGEPAPRPCSLPMSSSDGVSAGIQCPPPSMCTSFILFKIRDFEIKGL